MKNIFFYLILFYSADGHSQSSLKSLPLSLSTFSLSNKVTPEDTLVYGNWEPSFEARRNYFIKVTARKVFFIVETYEKLLLNKSFRINKAAYQAFAKSLDSLHIKSMAMKGEACVGSGSETLLLYAGTAREVKGFITYCGNQSHGTLDGDVEAAANQFRALVPDFQKRFDATEKKD